MPTAPGYSHLLARVHALMDRMERSPIVGISGHGGAGKSTLAARLLADLGGAPGQLVPTDRFYALGAGPGSGMFDLHDWSSLIDLLHRLRATPAPRQLIYSGRTYEGVERSYALPMPPVIIVEGIRLLRPETLPLLDLAVWIDLAPEPAGRRAVERNRRQGDSADELDLWRTKWIPEGHAYAEVVRPERLAHLVIPAAGSE